jgi:hypothetical protein
LENSWKTLGKLSGNSWEKEDPMSSVASIAGGRLFAPRPRLPAWRADVDPLACLAAFSATGLLASNLAGMMQASDPFDVLLQVALVGATAPFAALLGLAVGRQPDRSEPKQGGPC